MVWAGIFIEFNNNEFSGLFFLSELIKHLCDHLSNTSIRIILKIRKNPINL